MGGFEVVNTLGQRGSRLAAIVITGRGDAQTKAPAGGGQRVPREAGGSQVPNGSDSNRIAGAESSP